MPVQSLIVVFRCYISVNNVILNIIYTIFGEVQILLFFLSYADGSCGLLPIRRLFFQRDIQDDGADRCRHDAGAAEDIAEPGRKHGENIGRGAETVAESERYGHNCHLAGSDPVFRKQLDAAAERVDADADQLKTDCGDHGAGDDAREEAAERL